MKTVIDGVFQSVDQKVVPIFCNQGIHRCDTVSKYAVHMVLNHVNDPSGGRMYNAKVFDAPSVAPDGVVDVVCENAIGWLLKPFKVMDHADAFGVEAAQYSARTFKQDSLFASFVACIETDESTVIDPTTLHAIEELPDEDGCP